MDFNAWIAPKLAGNDWDHLDIAISVSEISPDNFAFVGTPSYDDLEDEFSALTFSPEPTIYTPYSPTTSTSPPYPSHEAGPRDTEISPPRTNSQRSSTSKTFRDSRERRKAQNRIAQRTYRQRKEQALRDQNQQITLLKAQLAAQRQANLGLIKAINLLKFHLKGSSSSSSAAAAAAAAAASFTAAADDDGNAGHRLS